MDGLALDVLLEIKQDVGELKGKMDAVISLASRVGALEQREKEQARKAGVLAGISAVIAAVLTYFSLKVKALFN